MSPPPSTGRSRFYLEHDGRSLTLNDWMRETGLNTEVIRSRLKAGWSAADALSVPQFTLGQAAKRAVTARSGDKR